ncbi:MAG: tRNA (adenosine(37)-N6)-dimethylallyltransferase MiaA [Planctomycetota bacterium]|jgi:tRNA dimethylallyltransferase
MPTFPANRIIVLIGPTAGGKSDLAIAVARYVDGEIINADSMQVYRRLEAATAKPSPDQLEAVPHHLVDCVDPTEPFTVADWLDRCEQLIEEIRQRGRVPVVSGGTNLYIKALLEGMFEGPGSDNTFRQSLETQEPAQLHKRLVEVDPAAAERIHPNDRKRIVRALEIHHNTGKPISELQKQWAGTNAAALGPTREHPEPERYRHNPLIIGLQWSVGVINRRINARVKAMFHPVSTPENPNTQDPIAETRQLLAENQLGEQAAQAIGTKQVIDHLEGRLKTADDLLERVKIDTRRFAKSQRTWLKRYRGVHWIKADHLTPQQIAERAIDVINAQSQS